MVLTPEKILEAIKDLPIKEALTYLVANKIPGYAAQGFVKIKKLIQDKHNIGKYGFPPDKEEARQLIQLHEHPNYKLTLLLIPNYRYIDIIRTGLLIRHYMDNDSEENKKKIGAIKGEIIRRPNGNKLLKIVRLPTTPYFSAVLNYLVELKKNNYSDNQLYEKFDEIVNDWEKSSFFIETGKHTVEDIISICKEQIKQQKSPFFVLGLKMAGNRIQEAIKKLEDDGLFRDNKYAYTMIIKKEGVEPMVQATIYSAEEGVPFLIK